MVPRYRLSVLLTCLQALVATRAERLLAEEYLTKASVTYLGWQVALDTFRICDGHVLAIDGGKIARTTEKCPRSGPPGPRMVIQGTVTAFEPGTRTMTVRDKDGVVHTPFIPQLAEIKGTATSLGEIKSGDAIAITEGAYGRAEILTTGYGPPVPKRQFDVDTTRVHPRDSLLRKLPVDTMRIRMRDSLRDTFPSHPQT